MGNQLKPTIHAFVDDKSHVRYLRSKEAAVELDIEEDDIKAIAKSAGALYELARTSLIRMDRLEEFMKHMRKVPGTLKMVQKEYVRIGEGSIIYSILSGTHSGRSLLTGLNNLQPVFGSYIVCTLIHKFSTSSQKSIVFYEYVLNDSIFKGEWFDLYECGEDDLERFEQMMRLFLKK